VIEPGRKINVTLPASHHDTYGTCARWLIKGKSKAFSIFLIERMRVYQPVGIATGLRFIVTAQARKDLRFIASKFRLCGLKRIKEWARFWPLGVLKLCIFTNLFRPVKEIVLECIGESVLPRQGQVVQAVPIVDGTI
jgi:hypothetical protein